LTLDQGQKISISFFLNGNIVFDISTFVNVSKTYSLRIQRTIIQDHRRSNARLPYYCLHLLHVWTAVSGFLKRMNVIHSIALPARCFDRPCNSCF